MSKYLKFVEEEPRLKTKIIQVRSTSSMEILGRIRWYTSWRQYCFYPTQGCIFNRECLEAIAYRCGLENSEHRKELNRKKAEV